MCFFELILAAKINKPPPIFGVFDFQQHQHRFERLENILAYQTRPAATAKGEDMVIRANSRLTLLNDVRRAKKQQAARRILQTDSKDGV